MLSIQHKLRERLLGAGCVFHHVPKCGGTSLNRAMRLRYIISQASIKANQTVYALSGMDESFDVNGGREFLSIHRFRQQMLHYYLHSGVKLISGHVRFSAAAYDKFSPSHQFITLLRDPVDRFVSEYKDLSVRQASVFKTNLSIEEFLSSDLALRNARTLTSYFSDSALLPEKYENTEVIEAQENLKKFNLIGFMNDMDGFNEKLNALLGVRIKIGHENKAEGRQADKLEGFTEEVREKIHEICAYDKKVYDFARSIVH
ncbi:hypothetical protein A3739_02080 [Oleiphilus sp. HI0067]|nr:hypothetical protein A3739_02080 [Oleiphilus sp. HI0067]